MVLNPMVLYRRWAPRHIRSIKRWMLGKHSPWVTARPSTWPYPTRAQVTGPGPVLATDQPLWSRSICRVLRCGRGPLWTLPCLTVQPPWTESVGRSCRSGWSSCPWGNVDWCRSRPEPCLASSCAQGLPWRHLSARRRGGTDLPVPCPSDSCTTLNTRATPIWRSRGASATRLPCRKGATQTVSSKTIF